MIKKLDDYRGKLITKILLAASPEEVKRYCHAAVNGLGDQQLQGYLIVRFLEETISDLNNFSPAEQSTQQWENIITAKVFCNLQVQQYYFSYE
jgi:hypothetical protein